MNRKKCFIERDVSGLYNIRIVSGDYEKYVKRISLPRAIEILKTEMSEEKK